MLESYRSVWYSQLDVKFSEIDEDYGDEGGTLCND